MVHLHNAKFYGGLPLSEGHSMRIQQIEEKGYKGICKCSAFGKKGIELTLNLPDLSRTEEKIEGKYSFIQGSMEGSVTFQLLDESNYLFTVYQELLGNKILYEGTIGPSRTCVYLTFEK